MSRSFLEITNEFTDYDDATNSNKNTPLSLRDRLPIIQIVGICCSMISFQVAYCIEYSLQVPIMKKLGLSNVLIAVITISGPFCSSIIQPFVETICDNCKSKFGRRRPFILSGGLGIIASFILMYFIDSIRSQKFIFKFLFSISLLLLNFSIQLIQKPSRSIVDDLVPQGQQAIANLVSSLILSLSFILTGFASYLISTFSEEKNIFLFAITAVFISVSVTLFTGKEEPLLISKENHLKNPLFDIFSSFKSMPTVILRILFVYLLCWSSYYPFILEFSDFFGVHCYKGTSSFDDKNYQNGVSFGMLSFSVMNFVVLVYIPFHDKIIQKVGMRNILIASQIVQAFFMIFIIFFSLQGMENRFVYIFFFAFLGIPAFIFSSIPFKIVELSVKVEQLSIYYGLMNVFAACGKQISAFINYALVGSFAKCRGLVIGLGLIPAFSAAVLCVFIALPSVESTIMEPLAPSSDYYDVQ